MIVLFFCIFLFTCMNSIASNVEVFPYFQSNMVLQSNKPIVVWGNADPKEKFYVSLGDEKKTVESDNNGSWKVEFGKREASFTPLELVVDDKIFSNILIGDVWICSGQSNMVFKIKASNENTRKIDKDKDLLSNIRIINYKGLRLIAKKGYNDEELKRCNTENFFKYEWQTASMESLFEFSAVATHFGLILAKNENVPIGLVTCAIGGSAIDTWIPKRILLENRRTKDWFNTDFLSNTDIQEGGRMRAKQAFVKVLPENGKYIIDEMKYHFMTEPSFLFESSFAKIGNVRFKGVLWYQGEADTKDMNLVQGYKDKFRMMMDGWRSNFDDNKLPFICIQLPSFQTNYWPEMRQVQYDNSVDNEYCYIVPTIDQGADKDIHYKDKKSVGQRAAYVALEHIYNKKIVSIPKLKKWKKKNNEIIIMFDGIGDGLSLNSDDNIEIEIVNKDNSGYFVKVEIDENNQLVIPVSKNVSKIRYAWKSTLLHTPLIINSDSIPVIPFEIEL